MRRARDTRSPMTHILSRDEVGVVRIATAPAAKRPFVSLVPLDESTPRTGCARVRWIHHGHSYADQGTQQRDPGPKIARGMGLPSNQPRRVFNCHASTRLLSYEHSLSGFTGQQLPLGTGFDTPVTPPVLVGGLACAVSTQNGPQVWPLIAVRACDAGADTDITAKPGGHGLRCSYGDSHSHAAVPLAVLLKDLALLAAVRPWVSQGAIQRSMRVGRHVQFAHALHHNPVVKARSLPGGLDLRRVNQLGLQTARLMPGLSGASPVRQGTPVRSARKLAHAFATGAAALLPQRGCAFRVMPRKKGRQQG